jgi:hypothetical protein
MELPLKTPSPRHARPSPSGGRTLLPKRVGFLVVGTMLMSMMSMMMLLFLMAVVAVVMIMMIMMNSKLFYARANASN